MKENIFLLVFKDFIQNIGNKQGVLIPNIKTLKGIWGEKRIGGSFSVLRSWVITSTQCGTSISLSLEFINFADYLQCWERKQWSGFSSISHIFKNNNKKNHRRYFLCVGSKGC